MPDGRRRAAAAGTALAMVVIAVAVILAGGAPGPAAGASQPRKRSGAATVQRRDLVATDTESGTLSYAGPHTVFNRLSGTVTSLPAVGQVVSPGERLYTVDGSAVVLMNGSVPAYRSLSEGVSAGADVQQLKQNLRALGFDSGHQLTTTDGTFDAATTAAVDRWQASLGETETGTVALGRIVFLPGPQRITTVDAALGSAGGTGGAGSGAGSATGTGTTASLALRPARPEFVSLTKATTLPTTSTTSSATTTTTTTSTAAATPPGRTRPNAPGGSSTAPQSGSGGGSSTATLTALVALLRAEVAELKRAAGAGAPAAGAPSSSAAPTGSARGTGSSARSSGGTTAGSSGSAGGSSGSASGASGSPGGSGGSGSVTSASGSAAAATAILQTTSTSLVVTVSLDATKQSEAVRGAPVTVQMPDGSVLDGTITNVSPVAQTSSTASSSAGGGAGGGGSAPTSTVPVTITLNGHRHTSGLDQAAVSVNFQQQKARGVLSVPVTALIATAGGGYAVQPAEAPNRLVPVTPGLFAAGYVEVSGTGIYPGLQVTDSQG